MSTSDEQTPTEADSVAGERPGPNDVAAIAIAKGDKEATLTVVTGDRILQCKHKPKKIQAAVEAIVAGANPEEAMTTAVSGVAGVGKSVTSVSIASVSELTWMSGESNAKVTYDGGGKNKRLTIRAGDQESLLESLGATAALHPSDAEQSQVPATPFEIAKAPAIGLAITIGIGALLYFAAGADDFGDEEGGGGRGRRRGRAIGAIAQAIGPNGVLLIAGAIAAFIAFTWFRTAQNPPTRTTVTF